MITVVRFGWHKGIRCQEATDPREDSCYRHCKRATNLLRVEITWRLGSFDEMFRSRGRDPTTQSLYGL